MGFISCDRELVDLLSDYKLLAYDPAHEEQVVALANDLLSHAEYIWRLRTRGMDHLEAVDRVLMILEVLEQDTSEHYQNIQQAFKGAGKAELSERPQHNMLGYRVQKLLQKIQRQLWLDAAFSKASRVAVRQEPALLPLKPPSVDQERRLVPEEDAKTFRLQREKPVPFLGEAEIVTMSDFVKAVKPEQHTVLPLPHLTHSVTRLGQPLEAEIERRIVLLPTFANRPPPRPSPEQVLDNPEVAILAAHPARRAQRQNSQHSAKPR